MKIRNVRECDRAVYVAMAREFYASPAVLRPVSEQNIRAVALYCSLGFEPFGYGQMVREPDRS